MGFDSIKTLCMKHYPDVVEPLCSHRERVLAPWTEAEADQCQKNFTEDSKMSYKRFQGSEKGPSELRAFVFHTLGLRGGWNGSGYKRFYLGHGVRRDVLAYDLDLTKLNPDEFELVSLGAPKMDEIVARLCTGLEELRARI